MNAVPWYVAVFVQGLVWSLPARPRLGIGFCCVAAYPLGLLLWVLVAIALAGLHVPFSASAVAAGSLFVVGLGLLLVGRQSVTLTRRELALAAGALVAFAGVATVLSLFNLSVLTYDSHVIVALGRSIAFYAGIESDLAPELDSRGIFQVMVQAASIPMGVWYLHAAPALLAVSSLVAFCYLSMRALRDLGSVAWWARSMVALTIVAISSQYWLVAQALYIHDNFAAAVYLFLFASCFWLAERERETAWLPFAHAFLLAFSLQRIEAPLVGLLFLAIAHTQSDLPAKILRRWAVAYALPLAAWCALLLEFTRHGASVLHQQVLTTERGLLVLGAIAGTMIGLRVSRIPRLSWARCHLPPILLAFAAVAFVAFHLSNPRAPGRSLTILAHMNAPHWGKVWLAFAVLAFFAWFLPAVPFRRLFTYGALIYLAGLFLYEGGAHSGWGDSRNRALTHVVLLIYFFLLMAYGRFPPRGSPAEVGSTPQLARPRRAA